MKLAFAIFLFILLIFIGIHIFSFIGEERALGQSLSDVQTRLVMAKSQEADLQAETQYLSNPTNLEKELRSNFNYIKPGEKMVVIVPAQASSTP